MQSHACIFHACASHFALYLSFDKSIKIGVRRASPKITARKFPYIPHSYSVIGMGPYRRLDSLIFGQRRNIPPALL